MQRVYWQQHQQVREQHLNGVLIYVHRPVGEAQHRYASDGRAGLQLGGALAG